MVAQKIPQILQLTPSGEIVFQGPFEHVVTSYLELKNPSDKRVCFKVKTTAPRRYCVRPNSGIVEPAAKIKIAIMLQPMDAESQAERNKHKFMVQSTFINGDKDAQQTDEIWQSATPEEIMDSKLRCVFQLPGQEQQEASPSKGDKEPAAASSTHHQQQQQPAARSTSGDGKQSSADPMVTSTPVVSRVSSSTSKPYATASSSASSSSGPSVAKRSVGDVSEHRIADKSVTSLTSSFLNPMSDDYKIVLVSLAMLILGVILGKYII